MTKGKAFVLCLVAIIFIFIAMYVISILNGDLTFIPVNQCLTGIGTLAAIFIGGSVANNGVKGKCWNQKMYDSENKIIVTSTLEEGIGEKNDR